MHNKLAKTDQAQQQPFTAAAKAQVMAKTEMPEKQWLKYEAAVKVGLFKLRTAYPTQSRNYNATEADALTALWLENFCETCPDVLLEAVARFIKADRKGFFPAPGLIMAFVDEIEAEKRFWEDVRRNHERNKRFLAEMSDPPLRIDDDQ